MPTFKLKINGTPRTVDADADTPLLWILRDHLDLTGTKFGCGEGLCGACTVLLDGVATRSCTLTVAEVGPRAITTIEGLAAEEDRKFKPPLPLAKPSRSPPDTP